MPVLRLLGVVVLVLALAGPAHAAPAEVRLLHGWRDGDTHIAGIAIELPRGWHTYWRVPGAGGIPPRFDWRGSRNLAEVRVEWPRPEVFESFGLRTIGYRNGVVLPILLRPEAPDAAIELALSLSFGVCKDICVPAEASLAARLEPVEAGAAPVRERAALEAALAARPHQPAEAGVVEATCRLARRGAQGAVSASVHLRSAPEREQVAVIEAGAGPGVWIGEARARTIGATVLAEAPVEVAGPWPLVRRGGLRLTLIDPVRVIDIERCDLAE